MSAPTLSRASGAATRSAYPVPVDAIVAQLRERLAVAGAEPPSRNQIMTEFRVGAPKANKVLALLADTTPTPDPTSATAGAADPDTATERVRAEQPTVPALPVPVGPDTHAPDTADTAPTSATTPPDTAVDAASGVVVSAPLSAPVDPDMSPDQPDPAPASTVADDAAPAGPVATAARRARRVPAWPVVLIALGAFVAIWGGWVELGRMTGFGEITPLPGIADGWTIDSAITLPLGVEAYAAFALSVWLSAAYGRRTRRFAMWSALGSLLLGMGGQIAYHLLKAAGVTTAPWQITAVVSCLPVLVLGLAAALTHLMRHDETEVTR